MAEKRHHESTNPDIESDVPGDVVDFLIRLSNALQDGDLDVLGPMYETELTQLTDKFYSTPSTGPHYRGSKAPPKHWPLPKYVKQHLAHTPSELVYQLHQLRSQYADRTVSPLVRKLAWTASEKMFDLFVKDNAGVDLPNAWIWDIVDEYLYQLQTHRIRRLRPELAQQVPAGVWGVPEAIARLEGAVEASGVRGVLAKLKQGGASEVFQRAPSHLKTVFGYCAQVGLVKLRVLLGDYVGALEAADALGVRGGGSTTSTAVPALHVSLHYHVGFAYIMLNRYADAVSTLQAALAVKAGARKFVDQMQSSVVSLLLVAGTLGDLPAQAFATNVQDRSRNAQDDDGVLLAQGDLERYRDVFLRSCPKFITAADVTSGTASSFSETGQEAKELQLRMFLRSVGQRLNVLKLRGYLSAYSTLTNSKVASLLQATAPASVEAHLIATKRAARQQVRLGDEPLTGGSWKRLGVIDFTAAQGNIGVQRHFEQPTMAAALSDRVLALSR